MVHTMPGDRREFLMLAGAAAIPRQLPAQSQPAPRQRFAVSTYSYWHFRKDRYTIERVIANAAELGFEGIEILHRQMTDETPAYVYRLEQAALKAGLALPMLSI